MSQLKELKHLNLSSCVQLRSFPYSIVHMLQLNTFRLSKCHKLENLPAEFGKLQSLVELDLSHCSELGCLPYSIMDLSQLKTFRLQGCHKLENLPMEFRKLESLVELDLSHCSKLGVFTLFNCGLVTTQDISIMGVPQIGESTNGVQETSKLGGT